MFGKSMNRGARAHLPRGTLVLLACLLLMAVSTAIATTPIRIAVLKFGTASWELDSIHEHGFDRAHGIALQVVKLASKQATMVALQSGEVDMALNDWLWVSRQRAAGHDLSFVPYSSAAGSLVVPKNSGIHSLQDLQGRRVGIAGGPLDKNWLLFQALAQRSGTSDLANIVTPVFAAPPLLNHQLETRRVDAVINFWPYVARLRAKGMHVVMDARDAAARLGIDNTPPLVGYVFDRGWAQANPGVIEGFENAVAQARALLADSDAEWERLRPLMAAPDQTTFEFLRDGFRGGIPQPLSAATLSAANRLSALLTEIGGELTVNGPAGVSPGTFWRIGND